MLFMWSPNSYRPGVIITRHTLILYSTRKSMYPSAAGHVRCRPVYPRLAEGYSDLLWRISILGRTSAACWTVWSWRQLGRPGTMQSLVAALIFTNHWTDHAMNRKRRPWLAAILFHPYLVISINTAVVGCLNSSQFFYILRFYWLCYQGSHSMRVSSWSVINLIFVFIVNIF